MLGYDVDPAGGRLIVNEKESRRVREIFALFLEHHSTCSGGCRAGAAAVEYQILEVGEWHGTCRPSLHQGIAAPVAHQCDLCGQGRTSRARRTRVSSLRSSSCRCGSKSMIELRAGRRTATGAIRAPQNALLAGLLVCKSCQRPMVPTYTAKPGRRYRYYVCQTVRQNGWSSCPSKSVPARHDRRFGRRSASTALRDSETRERLNVPEADWQSFEQRSWLELVRSLGEGSQLRRNHRAPFR